MTGVVMICDAYLFTPTWCLVCVACDTVLAAVAGWEWCTIAVFTCSESCTANQHSDDKLASSAARGSTSKSKQLSFGFSNEDVACSWAEEFVVVVNEQQCHTGDATGTRKPGLQR